VLSCGKQASFVLVWFRKREDISVLGAGFGISRATAYRYHDEAIRVLAEQAPDLHEALEQAKEDGLAYVILDGKVFSADRCLEKTTRVKGEQVDLWYSGKAHEHGGNVQALSAPNGTPLWVSEVLPGSVHDITAARAQVLGALYWAAAHLNLPTLADGGTTVPASAYTPRPNTPPATRSSTSTPAPATPYYADCAAWANAASPSSPDAGAHCSTSPPAPAKSAPSSKPHSSSPNSNTANSPDLGEITSLLHPGLQARHPPLQRRRPAQPVLLGEVAHAGLPAQRRQPRLRPRPQRLLQVPDGTEDWIVYHANSSTTQGCDINRTTRAQKFTWNADGTPNFGTPVALGTRLPSPSGEPAG
jgi:hypothetical protein